jgi:hypothetical protein
VILADTSIWIDFFRGKNKPLGARVQELLDLDELILAAPVRLEILSGCSPTNFSKIRRLLSALPVFYPHESTWLRLDEWIADAISAGQRFGVGDLVIASIAVDQKSLLWSLDTDFVRMKKLGWLQLYTP